MFQLNKGMTAARPSDLKRNNRIQILELFKSGSVYSVAEIARTIGISRQTVMKAIQFYLEKGIIVSDGKASSGSMGGKRAELFSLPACKYMFNILICPNGLQTALFNLRGETVDSRELSDTGGASFDEIADITWDTCADMMASCGVGLQDLMGVCVCVPGVVDRSANRLCYSALFPEWGMDIPVAETLRRYFGEDMLILVENVGRVCGSAYLHDPSSAGICLATVFSCWGGISSSHMDDGTILYGKDSLIGEIGHMILEPDDDEVCGCGCRGCFERQVSLERLKTIIAAKRDAFPESALARLDPSKVTLPDLFARSAAGDPLARELSRYCARYFASALKNLALTFNPDQVIFQGDFAFADDCFRQEVFAELRKFRYFDHAGTEDSPFRLRMDTRDILELTTLGAYTLLIDQLFSSRQTYE